jgi:membrane-associated phospholipid phosphatase
VAGPAAPEPHLSPFARALDALHLVAISFFLATALAGLARGADGAGTGVLAFGLLLAATAALAWRVRRESPSSALRALHVGWCLVSLPATFTALRWLQAAVARPEAAFDDRLAALDRDWLGVDVARWSEGFLTAPVADVFMVFYFVYFLMPLVAFGAFLRESDRARTYRAMFAVAFGVYACYMLYLLVPAAGPRHAYVNRSAPLPEGWITGRMHDFIRDLEPQPFDAFPSCHVVLGVLCAAMTWPFRRLRWPMAVAAAGTVLSTVVLRYHYVVDDLAGFAVVGLALGAVKALDARIARKAAPADAHGDRVEDLLAGDPGATRPSP